MSIDKLLSALPFSFLLLFASSFLSAQPLTILQARTRPAGTTVTVRGIVTNGAELGKIRFLQDGTAGLAVFPGTGSAPGFDAVTTGDSVEITGPTVLFHDLLEINPVTAWKVIASGLPLPAPQPVGLDYIPAYLESQLVSLSCATFDGAGGSFSAAGTYDLSDATGSAGLIYVGNGHPLLNGSIPGAGVRLTAIASRYDDWQLLPRSAGDLAAATCFYFPENPVQTDQETTGFTLTWQTNLPASAKLRYGLSPGTLDNETIIPNLATLHAHHLAGLQPGTVYWVRVEAQNGSGSIFSETLPFATSSLSSGQIKVYFNHPIDPAFAGGLSPDGQTVDAVVGETIARIDAAQQTIDVAMYTASRTDIVNALRQAQARGVRVRYIAALDGNSPALQPAPLFPVLYGNAAALMHNKFLCIDAGLSDKCWVMSGSLNWTYSNAGDDYNNTLLIQDQSLARAYELEFEEMWGSSAPQPNPAYSRFGAYKKNNTPHDFVIGGIPVESRFSPSDRTTARIAETLRTADAEALFAVFTFTGNEQGDALAGLFNGGVAVRGLIENVNDPGSEYTPLLSAGVNVRPHPQAGLLHHKYGVLDATSPASDPTVVTGSHNWTYAAETVNDENTLILHDADLATLFKAEFERRWAESGGVTHAGTPAAGRIRLFPNPAADFLLVETGSQPAAIFFVKDILGKTVLSAEATGGGLNRLNIANLPPGMYFVVAGSPYGPVTLPFQKI